MFRDDLEHAVAFWVNPNALMVNHEDKQKAGLINIRKKEVVASVTDLPLSRPTPQTRMLAIG